MHSVLCTFRTMYLLHIGSTIRTYTANPQTHSNTFSDIKLYCCASWRIRLEHKIRISLSWAYKIVSISVLLIDRNQMTMTTTAINRKTKANFIDPRPLWCSTISACIHIEWKSILRFRVSYSFVGGCHGWCYCIRIAKHHHATQMLNNKKSILHIWWLWPMFIVSNVHALLPCSV